jgi:hypothetical protein
VSDWTFTRHSDDTWSWLHIDVRHVCGSFKHFDSLALAVRDAAKHGYDAALPPTIDLQRERRASPRRTSRAFAHQQSPSR